MTHKRLGFLLTLVFGAALVSLFLVGCAPKPEPAEEPTEEAAEPPEQPPAEAEQPAEEPAAEAEPEAEPEAEEPAPSAVNRDALMNPSSLKETAPETYKVKFETSKGDVIIDVTRSWAPHGADRFYNLVKNGFYDETRFFRVMPNFIVQIGMNGDPKIGQMWQNATIPDDPVTKTNRLAAVTFATRGPNTRTTQIFINLRANAGLDSQGFAPFGTVSEGMDVVQSLYSGYGERPDQNMIRARGNGYLNEQFPRLDYIKKATILDL
jgi:peptidyl-prolyl cis-trans isomerase A (cyclophilin A)